MSTGRPIDIPPCTCPDCPPIEETDMSDLHPTPTRIWLLACVQDGHLRWTERKGFTLHSTVVNAKLAELDRAGWVEIINDRNRQSAAVTDAGRAVLAAHATA